MNLLNRIRSFWKRQPAVDHPLTEEERDEDRPQTGYGFNPGIRRGIRIGSARDGSVKYLIPDPCAYPYASGSSLAEGVTIDAEGNVYGADFLTDVRKFVLTRRR